MFESRISAVGDEKLPYSEKLRISSWSYDMVGHAKKCVERYCVVARLPDCDGQAADAISAYTQVKMEDAQKLLKNSQIGMSGCMDTSSKT